tara:strand:+ start:693 stop:1271 length:579 start_codon:yes stop_codon:yes gene_type:complete
MIDEYKNLEQQICDEIREWSKFALEKPNKNYNNLPSCPYAKNAWKTKKVAFAWKNKNNYEIVHTLINQFHDSKDLIIVIDMCFENNIKFHNTLLSFNELIKNGKYKQKDIWLMGFHPDDDVNELIDDGSFSGIVKEEYALIFVQRLSKLQESANKLKKLGYYDKYYNEYNVEDIYEQRQNYYDQLKRRIKWQ